MDDLRNPRHQNCPPRLCRLRLRPGAHWHQSIKISILVAKKNEPWMHYQSIQREFRSFCLKKTCIRRNTEAQRILKLIFAERELHTLSEINPISIHNHEEKLFIVRCHPDSFSCRRVHFGRPLGKHRTLTRGRVR